LAVLINARNEGSSSFIVPRTPRSEFGPWQRISSDVFFVVDEYNSRCQVDI